MPDRTTQDLARAAAEGPLRREIERLTRERDAALMVAYKAGRNFFGYSHESVVVLLANSLRAWLRDGGREERVGVSASVLDCVREAERTVKQKESP